MSQTSRDRVNSRHVRTHEKNSGDAVRRLGTIMQSIFCAQSGASIRLTVWEWSGESVPRGFSACAWKLLSHLFPRPDWPPLGLQGCFGISSSSQWRRAHPFLLSSCWYSPPFIHKGLPFSNPVSSHWGGSSFSACWLPSVTACVAGYQTSRRLK